VKFRAVIKKSGDWWIGWLVDLPGVNAQGRTREELIESLKVGAEDMLMTPVELEGEEELIAIELGCVKKGEAMKEGGKVEQLIKEYVKQCEQKSGGQSTYKECVKDMEKIDLGRITEKDVEQVIERFLYEWGRMGRVLGRIEFIGWKSKLVGQIRSNHSKLEDFKTKDLSEVDLSVFESDIKNCYKSFEKVVGRIAASKVLHLICPNFFPLWDRNIAKAIWDEVDGKGEKGEVLAQFSGAHYYRFMQVMQNFLRKYREIVSALANQYGKGKLKILDECLWWTTQRPLCLFF
jgi:predicted RNase H-like HicB family nuclease